MSRLAAVLIAVMIAGPAWGEEVLFCTETDSTGFVWDKGSSEGRPTAFREKRYIVKIISESKREITPTVGDTKGMTSHFTCRRPYFEAMSGSTGSYGRLARQIVCSDSSGNDPWIFHDNGFMYASLSGPPIAGLDPTAFIAYGTCVKY